MGIFSFLNPKASQDGKVALSIPNVANKIAIHLRSKWPELATIPGLWFSGSQVWNFLYPEATAGVAPINSDTDIFILKTAGKVTSAEVGVFGINYTERTVLEEVAHRLKLTKEAVVERPQTNPMYQSTGYDIKHERGDIDLWTAEADSVVQQLRMYPGGSHGHCRAAFSFTDGLVVLPNEQAK